MKIDYPIEHILPHAKPMILIDKIIACSEDFIHSTLQITADIPFFVEGGVPCYIALEYMAQTIAAWSGIMARAKQEKPKVGFLLGTRKLTLNEETFVSGDLLDIYGKLKYNDGEMACFDCWVTVNQLQIVSAQLNVFQPKDIGEFFQNNNNI